MRVWLALPVLGFTVVLGCQHVAPAPIDPAATARDLAQRSLVDPALGEFVAGHLAHPLPGWPPARWDLSLLTLAALYQQPKLAVARADWAVARAGIETAGARPNPSLAITPEFTSNAAAGVSPWILAAVLDWPIETAGKRGHRVTEAEQRAVAASLALASAAWNVRGEVRTSLVELAASRARVDRIAEEAATAKEISALLEDRLDAGAISRAETALAHQIAFQAQADLADAHRQEHEASTRLAAALAVPVGALADAKLELSLAPDPAEEELASEEAQRAALLGRADVLAALADYAASEASLRLELARQIPDLHIGPGYQYDQGARKWSIGIGLELPLLNRNEGPIAEAEARRGAAGARFLALQARVLAEIEGALARREGARAQLLQLDALLAGEREHAAATQDAFEAGAADRLALLTVRLGVVRAELAHLEAQARLAQSLADLELAVQRPTGAAALDPARTVLSEEEP